MRNDNQQKRILNPCKISSIPYWKAKSITVPDGMSIVHQDNFNKTEYQHYIDEPYFRLIHNLQNLPVQALPQGYSLYKATLKEFAEHINSCYSKIGVTEQHRGQGLGEYLVSELLRRMKDNAKFATVSGQCNNPANPEVLYRKCGFTGSDVWHVLRR